MTGTIATPERAGGMPPHLLVALSPHGYGHAAMTAPVITAVRRHIPDLRVTLQTALPADWLATRYEAPFALLPQTADFGLRMNSATAVDVEATAAAYRGLHARLDALVAEEAERLDALGVDLVLSNISYVALLAARRAGLPAVALSCLNWADMYGHYCAGQPDAATIEAEMLAAYRSADVFLRPAPAMPMPRLDNTRPIGPIARRASPDRAALCRQLGVEEDCRVGLISFGGMDPKLPFGSWPHLPGWRWVVAGDPSGHPHLIRREAVPMGFTELMCSCDVVITKPGYGTVAEAVVNGVPLLYVPRPDWPENPHLVDWLAAHGRCVAIEAPQMFDAAALSARLQTLFSLPGKALVDPVGAEEGAQVILAALARRSHMQP